MASDANKSFMDSIVGKAGALATSLALIFTPMAATAQNAQPASLKQAGKHVTLSYGPGFNPVSAESMARVISSEGCPVTLRNDGFIPDSIDVEVNGRLANFTSVGSAGSFALRNCTPG